MPRSNYQIEQETPQDWWEVEALFDLSFAPGREALSSYRLRDEIPPVETLCLVARDGDGILSGAVRHWPVMVSGCEALLLGPIAVHPTRQGEGLAGQLIGRCLEIARDGAWERIMLVGDLSYYARYGFGKLDGVVMPKPTNPDRVLGLELVEGAWKGLAGPVQRSKEL